MNITDKEYWVLWDAYQRRIAAAKMMGGILDRDVERGTAVVPKGWKHDIETPYYVPPGFLTSTTLQ